jgi:beta-lactamase regulating signal transducer with metallopeptidase domain
VITAFLSQLWVQRLGWTLVHFLWQGTAIVILFAVLRRALGRSLSAQGRYALACLALGTMAAAPPLTYLLIPSAGAGSGWLNGASPALQRLFPAIVAAWLLGVAAFSLRLAAGWRFTLRLRAASHPAPAEWQQLMQRTAERVGATRPVRLLVSTLADVPMVVGWLRPAILAPLGSLTGLPTEHIEALLAHELAHIRRHDYLASILQSVAEALLFYHPAVWWVSQQIRAERELCCDDIAVAASGDVVTYARALAALESQRPSRLNPALAANGGSLVHRVRRLIEPAQPERNSLAGPAAAWAMSLLWLAGIGVAATHAAQTPPKRVPTPAAAVQTAPAARPPAATPSRMLSAVLFDPFVPLPQSAAPQRQPNPPAAPAQTPDAKSNEPEKGVVAGIVVNSVTGEPVKKARVTLRRTVAVGAAVPATDSVVTDESGRFEFPSVYPGDCTLIASRPGFSGEASASSSSTGPMLKIELAPGERTTDLKLRLIPQGVISGRVVDENGDPVPDVYVYALRPSYSGGVRRFNSAGIMSDSTNDLGEYRIFSLTPGRYYVRTQPGLSSLYSAGPPATADRVYLEVYYPNATGVETATRVEVRPGAEVGNVNLALRPARAARVRGRVVDGATGQAPARAFVSISSIGGASGTGSSAQANTKGEFDLGGVLPGAYTITASGMVGSQTLSMRDTVTVDANGLTGVLLRLTPGAKLAGTLRVEGGGELDLTKVRVALGSLESTTGPSAYQVIQMASGSFVIGGAPASGAARLPGEVDAQGGFALENVSPYRMRAFVNGLPVPYYLKTANFNDQETINTGFEAAGAGPYRLDLVVSGDGAQLDGIVLDSKDKPAREARVMLIPVDPALRATPRLYMGTSTAQKGQFTLKAIPPGKYRIYAWEGIESGAWFDPDFMARYETQGESVSLEGKDRKTLTLKLLPVTEEPSR